DNATSCLIEKSMLAHPVNRKNSIDKIWFFILALFCAYNAALCGKFAAQRKICPTAGINEDTHNLLQQSSQNRHCCSSDYSLS
ncbi:MAG: hypothetical protein V2I33_03590, partial [Kangiellaceae bacterium]|nr:hypothetical protein [Kangiellaceae bacterium]